MAKSKQKKGSIQRFLLSVLVFAVTIPAMTSGAILIQRNYAHRISVISQFTAEKYLKLLNSGMELPLWNISPELGEPLIKSVSIDPSVTRIEVRTESGDPFLRYGSAHDENVRRNTEYIHLKSNIWRGQEFLGSVQLDYNLFDARQTALNESRLLITILFVQLVFTLATAVYFLSKRIVNPLNQLKRAAVRITTGDFKTAIPPQTNDEFGALSVELESMRGSLESLFASLEDRVSERTIELVSVNEELKDALDKLKRTQGDLVQSEKLAALGALVAGVSHELNTPIGNGLTVASSMKDTTEKLTEDLGVGITKSALENYLANMSEGAHLVVGALQRASELVTSFKQVAADRASAQRRRFNVLEMMNETLLTASPAFKHTPYVIEINCDANICMESYPGPLGQVITNLLNNVLVHAFFQAEHGRISIVVEEVNFDNLRIVVCDDGVGISPKNLKHIFDPFFTTKLGGGGNGLGLHIVHNIITSVLGGYIRAESVVGSGTTFIVDLPNIAPKSQSAEFL